jgi:PAS domain S-box-containing protein
MIRNDEGTSVKKRRTRQLEIAELQTRLSEAEATLSAIRNGEVDALIVSGEAGEKVYTLEGAETPYRELVERMSEGAVTIDSAGVILYANRRFSEMVGQPLERVVGTELRQLESGTAISAFMAELEARPECRSEAGLRGAAGETVPVLVSGTRDEDSGRLSIIVTDLTVQKRSEAMERAEAEARAHREMAERRAVELARSNADLESFAYAASHDLKEPVRGIANYAQFLLSDYREQIDDEGRAKLQTIVRLCMRMHGMLDALLECSRAGRTQLHRGPVCMKEVVREALDSIDTLVKEHAGEIRVQSDECRVLCDRDRLGQVITNLVSNGLKYNSSDTKTIEIGWHPPKDGMVTCFVRDNGIGIEPRLQERIFGLFRRLHARDAFGGGTGVGLSLVKTIIEQHGGRVWVESEKGAGSTFYVTVPADQE